jgi:hypothetical protein
VSYVFDNSPLSTLFRNYYPQRFPTLWKRFHQLVADGNLVSTREVLREIEDGPIESLTAWAWDNEGLFEVPTKDEGAFVTKIYAVRHFQQNIEQQKILKGGKNADAFVVAKAAVDKKTVVTMETLRPDAARIPNICQHFNVPYLSLEGFMEKEDWQF